MNQFELLQLRSMLPRGYRTKIRELTNFSYSYIDQVLSGTRHNDQIIEVALQILQEDRQSRKLHSNRFRQILDLT